MVITDTDGENTFITDWSTLLSQLNVHAGQVGAAGRIRLDQALVLDGSLASRGELSSAGGLAAGDVAISLGDATVANQIAALFSAGVTIAAAGTLPTMSVRLADYAATILSQNAAMASANSDELSVGESYRQALVNQAASVSQVNLDEEMANIIILQNAYAAAARVTTTASEMLDTLLAAV